VSEVVKRPGRAMVVVVVTVFSSSQRNSKRYTI
jgi:hypothetical protein